MSDKIKIGRNDPCPCGSGQKYKSCCEGKVDWSRVLRSGEDYNRHLSIRGRNLTFINRVADALQLDSLDRMQDYKAAFTPQAVREIHEAVLEVWPRNIDITKTLNSAKSGVSGLYVGDYRNDAIFKGIVRHSIYATKILLIDPFFHPASVRDEYNPILRPEKYRAQTLKNVNFWLALVPWINAGIVEVIRTPADFDHRLMWESLKRQRKKFEENQELKTALEKSVEEMSEKYRDRDAFKHLILSAPDESLRRTFDELNDGKFEISFDDFLSYINRMRDDDLDFLEPASYGEENAQMHIYSTGASYDIAKLTSDLTGSYLVTDIPSKWKEIEVDRNSQNATNKEWTPFAKAFGGLDIKFLNNIELHHALTLREENRLESMRVFLRKVWKSAQASEHFDEANAALLADELTEEVKKAEEEWKKIDRDLLKWFGAELSAGLLSAEPLISSGHASFLAAAVVSASAITFGLSKAERTAFPKRYPAAFFMNIKDNA